jgi:hypothetical protein
VKKLAFAAVCTLFCASAVVQAQDDLKISGDVEIWADLVTVTDNSDTAVASFKTETRTEQEVDLTVKLEKQLTDMIKFTAKLDCEDTAADNDLVEEAYVTWAKALGDNVDLAFGRKEIEFGQDRKLWETEAWTHHFGEEDNKMALEFGIKAGDAAKIYLTNWQSRTGMWQDDKNTPGDSSDDIYTPRDSFLFQSFALKGEIKAADNLMVNVSYLNEHDDLMLRDDSVADYAAAGYVPNQTRISVGVDYSDKEMGLRAWFEYLMVNAIEYTDDIFPTGGTNYFIDGANGSVIQVGVKYKVDPKLEVGLNYEMASATVDNDKIGVDKDAFNSSQIVVGAAYCPDSKNPVVLEIVMDNATYEDDSADVKYSQARTTITIGTIVKF